MLRIATPLLAWFHENRRSLPFRDDPTPYHIWVSEVMLQQTRMNAVLPYYERFMRELPDPAALAACDSDRLHKLWEGLGYYSRADNLRRAAAEIVSRYGGELPHTYEELRALPGIGDYTAGAIASISMQIAVPAVDGNVMRVFSRLYNDRSDITLPETKRRVTQRVSEEQPKDAPGDFNQALMELGALVCVPGEPRCGDCPLSALCGAHAAGSAASLPARAEKKPRRVEELSVLLVHTEAGVLLTRRPARGLLAGMWQPPLTERLSGESAARAFLKALLPGAQIETMEVLPDARHLFTHIEWRLNGWNCTVRSPAAPPQGYLWAGETELAQYAVPNAFRAYKKYL
ncbi:MAG: A/G-specific adenine glycosylase [Eubacteriales bacterium]